MKCEVKISSSSTLNQSHSPVYVSVFTYISIYITYKWAHIAFYTDGNSIIYLYTLYICKYVLYIYIYISFFNMSESSMLSMDAEDPIFIDVL